MEDMVKWLRAELEQVQTHLKERTVEATADEGMVKVTANGHQEVTAIYLDPRCLYPRNQANLQDAVLAAVNEALLRSRNLLRQEISRLTGGMDLSNFNDFF